MNNPTPEIRVELSSPPDRDYLVANILVDTQEFAEINQEQGFLQIEVYPRQDSKPWNMDYLDLIYALKLAKERLDGQRN